MTNSEAIAGIEAIKKQAGYLTDATDDPVLVLNMGIQALKEAEPRVMTFNEVYNYMHDVYYIDFKGDMNIYVAFMDSLDRAWLCDYSEDGRFVFITYEHTIVVNNDDYKRTLRCWDKRPTDEQRKAVAWDG